MNRIDRLTSILTLLQGKKKITAQEIADRYEISVRTVYRDIRALEEGGVPIGAEAGVGYFLMDGYSLPPILFTKEEAAAIMIGSKLIASKTDDSVAKEFESALDKIKAVLKSTEKELFETLDQQIQVLSPNIPKKHPDKFIIDIQTALAEKRVLRIGYHANYTDETSDRDIAPISLCFYSNKWHLVAYCYKREAMRDFRTDRISSLTFTPKTYDIGAYKDVLSNIGSLLVGSELNEVCIWVPASTARYIQEQKYYYGFIKEEKDQDGWKMVFMIDNLYNFGKWLLSFGSNVRVMEPQRLKSTMHELVQELQATHSF